MSALQQFRALRQEHEEKKKELPPVQAVMARCSINTSERNRAWNDIKFLKANISKKREEHIKMLDRLHKYENVEEEFFKYIESEDMMIKCESSRIGVFSKIDKHITKNSEYLAHFTIYDTVLKKCKTDDEKPISYTGYFKYKHYKKQFDILMRGKNKSFQSLLEGDF